MWSGFGLLLYALTGFLLIPWLLERTLQSTLQERLSLDSRVESIQFNPFSFSLRVKDLEIREQDGAALASLSELLVNFELSSLFRWALSFDELHLTRPQLSLNLVPDSNNFAALAQRWQASAEPTVEPPETKPADGSLPRLYIGDLKLIGGGLTLTDHRRSEPFEIQLGPIDLEIADLSTLPETSGTQQAVIRGEDGTEISWTGNLSLNPIRSDGRLSLRGSYSPILYRYLKEQLPFAMDRGEVDVRLHYLFSLSTEAVLELTLDEINGSLTGLVINEHDGTRIGEVGRYEMAGGELHLSEKSVEIDSIRLTDVDLDVVRRDDASFNLVPAVATVEAPSEQVEVAQPAPEQASAPWEIAINRFELNVSRLGYRDESVADARIETTVDVALTGISNRPGASIGVEARMQPTSGGTLNAEGAATLLPEFGLQLAIDVAGLALDPAQPYLSEFARVGIESGTIALQGTFKSGAAEPFDYQGGFELADLVLNDQIEKETLLSVTSLGIDELHVNPGGLEISLLRLKAPYTRIEIEQDNSNNIQRTLLDRTEAQATAADTIEVPESAGEPFAMTIGAIEVSDASARFTDLALPLPFEANISGLAGKVSAISTTSRTPAELEFEGRVNDWGQVTLTGALRPWAPRDLTRVDVKFRNVDLPSVSPYTIKFAGREIASGRTDLDLSYALQNGNVTGANRLVIRDLTLGRKVENPDAMSLPLDLAVALLKNSEGVIDLDIPVKGSFDDPEFSYSNAVVQVFGNLIVKLVASPFRLLGALVGIKSEDFGAVAFAAGRSDLAPPEQEKLQKLATALEQRPQLRLAVPGLAVQPADGRALARADIEADIKTEIGRRITAQSADSKQTNVAALLSERRQRAAESLYLAAGIMPPATELRTAFLQTDEEGNQNFDDLAFTAAMISALIDARPVSAEALTELANKRANAVIQALADAGISEDRITRTQDQIIQSKKPVVLPLEVVAH